MSFATSTARSTRRAPIFYCVWRQLRHDPALQDQGSRARPRPTSTRRSAILASGKTVALDPDKYPSGYEPISEVLEAGKAQFLNGLYESQATNGAIAGLIAQSVISTGDYRSYLLDVDKIKAAKAEQVSAALDKYLLKGTISWVALGPSEVLASARPEAFETFAAPAATSTP